MGLIRTALVFGAGYIVGRPDGTALLRKARTRATELVNRPEVKRARERARDVAGDQALALKRRLPARSGTTGEDGTSTSVPVSDAQGWDPSTSPADAPADATTAPTDEPLSASDPSVVTSTGASTDGQTEQAPDRSATWQR
ncbi:hypothetical protein [Pseudonocardia xishanensis]|uniref:YtxH domain-containing protein n=1 Tax=Pseudonocardia xishanensis TaxID=630995 RepID=A0ABP8RSF4_9PSEU